MRLQDDQIAHHRCSSDTAIAPSAFPVALDLAFFIC